MPATGRTVRLDRTTILDAVQRIVEREGLGKLTMRRIGAELGADPTAVYRHFRSKDELLRELADRAFTTKPEAVPEGDWRAALRANLDHSMRRFRTHPDFATLLARTPDESPSLMRVIEQYLQYLHEAGFEPEQAARVYQLIENHEVGVGLFYALLEQADDPRFADLEGLRARFAALPRDQFPRCAEAAPYLFPDMDQIFAWSSELLLDLIDRLPRTTEDAPA